MGKQQATDLEESRAGTSARSGLFCLQVFVSNSHLKEGAGGTSQGFLSLRLPHE